MRRLSLFLLALLIPAALAAAPAPAPEPSAAPEAPKLTGSVETVEGIPVLRLSGTPHERGFAQGFLYAEVIVGGFDRGLAEFLGDEIDVYTKKVLPLAGMGFKFTKDELTELEGMLAGIEARLPDPKDRTLACLSRPITLVDLKALNTFGDWYDLGCSSLALWGEDEEHRAPAVVRNFDFPPFELLAKHQHLRVVVPPPGAEGVRGWVGVSHPGSIGVLTFMNEEGVFGSIHDVPVTPGMMDLVSGNVPRLLAMRRLAEELGAEGAVETAVAKCRTWLTLYGSNFLIATPKPGKGLAAGVLEYDTRESDDRGVDLRGPDENGDGEANDFVACTNHHRIRGRGTCRRFEALTAGAAAVDEALELDALFELASRAAVPAAGRQIGPFSIGTLHQTVALTGKKLLALRTAGVGENIRDKKPVLFDVAGVLAGRPGRGAAE